jgi:hypothetical protein
MKIGMGHGLGVTDSVVLRPKAGDAGGPDLRQMNNFRNIYNICISITALLPSPDDNKPAREPEKPNHRLNANPASTNRATTRQFARRPSINSHD